MEWNKVIDPVLWGVAAIVAAVYIIIPLTNDARIYLGVAHIAANYYPFPQGIDLAWEIKPIANRILNYALYKIATVFVPFDNHFLFGVAIKLLAIAAVIAVALYFSRVIRQKYSFLLIFFSFTAMANFCILQAEYWAALFAVLAIALLVSENWIMWILSGIVIVWIFLLKGITGLLVVPIICGAYILIARGDVLCPSEMIVVLERHFERGASALFGLMITLGFFLIMTAVYWPHTVSDMLLSAPLARVGMVGPINLIVWFVAQLILSPLYIPVMLTGLVFGSIFYFAWVQHQGNDFRAAYILMWIFPAAIVFAQGEMFLYHYLAFVPSAIVSITMCERAGE